ncbi:MAG: bifunctional chorismate mutase/prephenate dehydratase, partial [Ruminococcaceae bacterium]|nr:bifunctional chorismate mutase/prephenate dehydratase [Oscillospiraceae bacterium]
DAVKIVADFKRENGLPIDDFEREAQIIKTNTEYVKNPDYRSYYVNFLQENINLSKKMQHKLLDGMKVAYSGVEGAFANIATEKIFPDALAIGYKDFKTAYNAVVKGECDCAVLPIENSHNGDVAQVLDLAFFGNLFISGIYEIEIIQNLLANKGATVSSIKEVISHPQALGQCTEFINEKGYKTTEAVNTAVAAKTVAQSKRADIAAIGSIEAAKKFGLEKIEGHINESGTNTTRFAVFTRADNSKGNNDNHFVMLFTVKNTAGSLGEAITVIGKHGFNLKALKSRPTKELVWDYYFFAEGEGNIESEQGKLMLCDLQKCCNHLKILGRFEKEILIK